jgi:hypothetical protein
MRKAVKKMAAAPVLAVALFTCLAGCATTVTAPLPSVLTEAQEWTIALSGIMNEMNNTRYDALYSRELDKADKKAWLTMLKRD